MADVSVVVSVCRGVGTGTGAFLSDHYWRSFKADVLFVGQMQCGAPVSANDGRWYHEKGVEQQYLLVFGALPKNHERFVRELGRLAKLYRQDSIALLIGVPEFIGPDGKAV